MTVARLAEAVRSADLAQVRAMLEARPEFVNMDVTANDEHRALHFAVLDRSPEMVRLLMEFGADARKGIYPHRGATSALTLASERGFGEIVAIIREEEQRRHGAMSDNVNVVTEAILSGDEARAIAVLEGEPALKMACTRGGWSALHVAAAMRHEGLVRWLLVKAAAVNHRGPGNRTPLDQAVGKMWEDSETFAAVVGLLLCERFPDVTGLQQ